MNVKDNVSITSRELQTSRLGW